MKQREKTVEDIYQKMSPIEHILKRPDTYIGSTSRQSDQMWVWDEETEKMQFKNLEYVPGLFKIFDEVLVNAADNFRRSQTMNQMKVIIDADRNFISVWNNGEPIPVQIHKEHKMYVPELIFGVLLTGSNYDDSEKRVVGGRNGYGAKLTNVYSKKFTVEVNDGLNNKYFNCTWSNNMSNKTIPEVKEAKSKENFVCVTFHPDLPRFSMAQLEPDIVSLMKKRVYDMAGIFSGKIKVSLNGNLIKINSFLKYVDLYLPNKDETIKIYDKDMTTPRWEVLATYSATQFQQVSFVNAISTSKGGTHVNHVCDKIVNEIQNELSTNKKYKGLDIQKYQIKQSLWIFINCLIDNPAFDSQTKENMTTKVSEYGGEANEKFQVTEKFSKALLKTDIIEAIVTQAKAKANAKLNKTLKGVKAARLTGIEKLDDANDAGRRNSHECTLILTEGDSAKSLVMAAIDIIGRDRFGVYPLRGKFLNVRDAPGKQIMNNEEIQNLIKIMGLQKDKQYEDLRSLRYGSIMLMADQDTDGSHIKGLMMNFIHHFWPSLVQMSGFLTEFVTPIIKVTKGQQHIQFFTVQDFKRWADAQGPQEVKSWNIKYYKGLGTSDDEEAKDYFSNLQRHRLIFKYENDEDDKAIDLCFNKSKANERKDWLSRYDQDLYVDHNKKEIRYVEFINKELIHFSMYDNIRSIPSIMDGLKPGHRKVLFCCFKRNLKSEIKVIQLGGYVSEHSAYHHGETSLFSTIIGMAQNFPGSNNLNLLVPKGQFGSRLCGGKDHASARYIHTHLSKTARALFPEADDHILTYKEDDGHMVEPEFYVPIIPLVLVNGSEGIGTGWSSYIPNYNPKDLIEQVRRKLNGEKFQLIHPWYRGWNGEIIPNSDNKNYTVRGLWEWDSDSMILQITELPLQKWTKDYKDWIEKSMQEENSIISDFREYHTKHTIHFEIQLNQEVDFQKFFKLSTSLNTTNMVLFDSNFKLQKYSSVIDIMEEYYQVRLVYYDKRKGYQASKLEREIQILSNKVRFILAVLSEEIKMRNIKKRDLVKVLTFMKFTRQSDLQTVKSTKLKAFGANKEQKKSNKEGVESENASEDEEQKNVKPDTVDNELNEYNYLLSMPLMSLTYEKVEKLKSEHQEKSKSLQDLLDTPIKKFWLDDLDNLERVIIEQESIEAKAASKQFKGQKVKPMKKAKKFNEETSNIKEEPKKPRGRKANAESQSDITQGKRKKQISDNEPSQQSRNSSEIDGDFQFKQAIKSINSIKDEISDEEFKKPRVYKKKRAVDSEDDDDSFHI